MGNNKDSMNKSDHTPHFSAGNSVQGFGEAVGNKLPLKNEEEPISKSRIAQVPSQNNNQSSACSSSLYRPQKKIIINKMEESKVDDLASKL
mmetsp:Transcript_33565/g.51623  ORF Transcript_33565/g.51623 Transcript_33565/m.51623 type:complete len:91 (-) Transcript_33565:1168-1440(-)|eukprot:CAMPEP_0170504528 /NCGR_PEP_ID=MMETSP0208-20121228/48198_1 /TAXON_ID=197538 /ORGANISM="Strombidium inclinatum, Strain S3" /LENGTH=90 /DNA_ID=CAMNT_0010784845 /DNA_START=894 /DNA_END=1166 /DNA_ORIENTATION=-